MATQSSRFREACKTFVRTKKGELEGVAKNGPLSKEQKAAFTKGVLAVLEKAPVETLLRVVHYVPSDGVGDTDGAAAYYRKADETGANGAGAKGLTLKQRVKLVNKLLHHNSKKELFGVFDSAPNGEALHLLRQYGYDRVREVVSEGGKFTKAFDARFPAGKFKLE